MRKTITPQEHKMGNHIMNLTSNYHKTKDTHSITLTITINIVHITIHLKNICNLVQKEITHITCPKKIYRVSRSTWARTKPQRENVEN